MVPFKTSIGLICLLGTCAAARADLRVTEADGPPTGKNVRIQQLERDESGPTSVRFYAPRTELPTKTDDLVYARDGKVAHYYYRDRDLGQVFKTGAEGFVFTSLTLRLQPVDVEGADPSNAKVSIQLLKVSGQVTFNDNGTTAGKNPPYTMPQWSTYAHKWPHDKRDLNWPDRRPGAYLSDDFITGESYESLAVISGGIIPASLSKDDYVRFEFTGKDRHYLDPNTSYAFLVMFDEPAAPGVKRNLPLSNKNILPGDRVGDVYPEGHAIRREGASTMREDVFIRDLTNPADVEASRRAASFPTGMEDRLAIPPGTLGYPDVDTYRDFYFIIEGEEPDGFVDEHKGSDAAQGNRQAPWKTIGHAANEMPEGGICVIRQGTYRETVTPKDGQIFHGEKDHQVFITGCDLVAKWSQGKDEMIASVPHRVRQVFVNGVHQNLARHPNEDGDPFGGQDWITGTYEKSPKPTLTFSKGPGFKPDHWVGGWYSGLHGPNCYNAIFGKITKSHGHTLTLSDLSTEASLGFKGFLGEGKGYIINHPAALDAPGEWYWSDGGLKLIPEKGSNLNAQRVEAQVRLWGFDLSHRKNVRLEGLRFKAASVLLDEAHHCLIDRCTFRYHAPWGAHVYTDNRSSGRLKPYNYCGPIDGTSGIHITGSGNIVRNTSIAHAWGGGIALRGDHGLVENCRIENVGWLARQCANPICGTGTGNRIRRNTIRHTGSTGIRLVQIGKTRVKKPVIEFNDIADTGLTLVDGGSSAIYLSNHDSPTDERSLDGGIVAYNRIGRISVASGNKGFGIYLDDGTDHAIIHHNVINAGGAIRWGIFLHYNTHFDDNITVAHNTVWGYREAAVSALGHPKKGGTRNVLIRNNLAEKGGFIADLVDHNRGDVPPSEFANIQTFDFRITDPDSPSLDAGVPVPDLPAVSDSKPDLGAYEFGTPLHPVGSNLSNPTN